MASPDKKSFLLRIDPALWKGLERLAAVELRSVNAQIEYLLRESLAKRGIGDEKPSKPAIAASQPASGRPPPKRRA